MITMIGAELSFVAGIGGVILQLALLFIVFSLPGRFREQQEYLDKRLDAIEAKLDALLAEEKTRTARKQKSHRSEQVETRPERS